MSSSPGHLNKEKNPASPPGQEPLPPPSHHLLLPCAWNTDVSSSRLLGMNVGCSNELICLQDMLICQAGCNHACNLTVWRFLPGNSWNPKRVRTFSSKSQEASVRTRSELSLVSASRQLPYFPLTVSPTALFCSALKLLPLPGFPVHASGTGVTPEVSILHLGCRLGA